jgi:hypothetical protein
MSFTMRERGGPLRLVFLWLLITVFAAAAGPFGTFEELRFPGRLAYWAVIAGASILLTRAQLALLRGRPEALRLAAQLPYGIVLALLAHGMNLLIFPDWGGWADFGFLLTVTLSVVLLVEIGLFLLRNFFTQAPEAPAPAQEEAAPAPELQFLRRLPLDKRGALVRREAQDHYLLAVTSNGAATVLMRLGDAERELAGFAGLRVHRSHWVALAQVQAHARRGGRDFLQMSDGSEVPVSRSFRPAAQEAGLF